MSIVNGTDLMLFIGGHAIAYSTNHSLSTSAETQSLSVKTKDNKGGAWQTNKVTNFSWSASSENLYSVTGENGQQFIDLFEIYKSGQSVLVELCVANETTQDAPSTGWTPKTAAITYSGNAFITSLELNAPDEDNASYTIELTGDGELNVIGGGSKGPGYQGGLEDNA